MTDEVRKLIDVCDSIVTDPELEPSGRVTYCNVAVTKACEKFGITEFRGMMANDICDWIFAHWDEIEGSTANDKANQGIVCIAAQKGTPHGHVAIVYPGSMVFSEKWGCDCPLLANVGEKNAIMGANWCFEDKPLYYTPSESS